MQDKRESKDNHSQQKPKVLSISIKSSKKPSPTLLDLFIKTHCLPPSEKQSKESNHVSISDKKSFSLAGSLISSYLIFGDYHALSLISRNFQTSFKYTKYRMLWAVKCYNKLFDCLPPQTYPYNFAYNLAYKVTRENAAKVNVAENNLYSECLKNTVKSCLCLPITTTLCTLNAACCCGLCSFFCCEDLTRAMDNVSHPLGDLADQCCPPGYDLDYNEYRGIGATLACTWGLGCHFIANNLQNIACCTAFTAGSLVDIYNAITCKHKPLDPRSHITILPPEKARNFFLTKCDDDEKKCKNDKKTMETISMSRNADKKDSQNHRLNTLPQDIALPLFLTAECDGNEKTIQPMNMSRDDGRKDKDIEDDKHNVLRVHMIRKKL